MRLPAIFSDHMVLQQQQPIPVWGWSKPGAAVSVSFAGKTAKATADRDGAWLVSLPEIDAGGPFELTVSGDETISFSDVLVGEVWVCSGQSNMEWTVDMSANPEQEIFAAKYPRMRLFTVAKRTADRPLKELSGAWAPCEPLSAAKFSAVGYYFGRKLLQDLNTPIGLINSSWGGTRAEAWTSIEGLKAEPALKDVVAELGGGTNESPEETQARYAKLRVEWCKKLPQDQGNRGLSEGWAKPEFDDSAWKTMRLPTYWEQAGILNSGVLWFRLAVDAPAAWAGQELQLSLGAADKSDDTYFNGQRVGGISFADEPNSWNICRVYTVPAALVRPGRNVIAVRLLSNYTGGGLAGSSPEMNLRPRGTPGAQAIPLYGNWRYCIEQDFGPRVTAPAEPQPPNNANTATALFNGMLAPVIPYGVRGAIWYQGESNAGNADRYRVLFPQMIRDWRQHWNKQGKQGDFPFYFVQLANYGNQDLLAKSNWAFLRESQTQTLALPNTGMAVSIDIGEHNDIHPRNKQDVGLRLALNALAKTYGKKVAYRGPVYRSHKVEGSAVRVSFENAAGLRVDGSDLSGFIIAGADRRFALAKARIENDTVVVSSADVAAPVAVRYGWADSPTCKLYNGAGLPAEPFRTDDWPM